MKILQKAHIKRHIRTVVFIVIAFLISYTSAHAIPPTTPYNPNETLDPSCAPGDTNCYVTSSGSSSDDLHLASDGVIYEGSSLLLSMFNYGDNGTVTTEGHNIFLGINAGNTTMGADASFSYDGSYNTAVGNNALHENTTGSYNTALGSDTLTANTVGLLNTAVGSLALTANTIGNSNIAIGARALYSNDSGSNNVAVGQDAMYANTSGTSNSVIGYRAFYANTVGSANTAIGWFSLSTNTTGNSNTAVGTNSLRANTTGGFNNAFGHHALTSNTTGTNNNAFGYLSLPQNNIGTFNSSFGDSVLFFNTSGSNNSGFGYGALYSNSTGSSNVGIGYNAGRFLSDGSSANATATNSTYLGTSTMSGGASSANETVIGYNSVGHGSNTVTIGNTSITDNYFNGNILVTAGKIGIGVTPDYPLTVQSSDNNVAHFYGTGGSTQCTIVAGTGISCTSDMTMKKDITLLNSGDAWTFITPSVSTDGTMLDKIMALQPVAYHWKTEKDEDKIHAGFIAQDVQEIFPDLVDEDQQSGLLTLNMYGLLPYTIAAVQDMNIEIHSIDDLGNDNALRDELQSWFGDMKNGIVSFFANTIKTKQLCVQDNDGVTCINRSQLDSLLNAQTTNTAPTEPDTSAADNTDTNTPDPEDTDTSTNTTDTTPEGATNTDTSNTPGNTADTQNTDTSDTQTVDTTIEKTDNADQPANTQSSQPDTNEAPANTEVAQ